MAETIRIHLTGHHNIANRGCEAIVRGTAQALGDLGIEATYATPSFRADVEERSLANDSRLNVLPIRLTLGEKVWRKLVQTTRWSVFQRPYPMRPISAIRDSISDADVCLSVGGDNYSLDYGYPSALMAHDRQAFDQGVPCVLWGASVGPFPIRGKALNRMVSHLSRFSAIFLREDCSLQYLESLGLQNLHRMPDPGFFMAPAAEFGADFSLPPGRWIGLNVSPLVLDGGNEAYLSWIQWVEQELHRRVVLVPHVIPYHGGAANNDYLVLRSIFDRACDRGLTPVIAPPNLTAPEYKRLISLCEMFIGGRTHTTIAAWSSKIPCLAIGYSIKASGLVRDLFGNEDLLVRKADVTSESLITKTTQMIDRSAQIRETLNSRIDEYKLLMRSAGDVLTSLL